MSVERKIYIGGLILMVAAALFAVYHLVTAWSINAPLGLLTALALAFLTAVLTGYTAWRGLQGIRPAAGDPVSIALKLLGGAIFLSLFGPRIWAVLAR